MSNRNIPSIRPALGSTLRGTARSISTIGFCSRATATERASSTPIMFWGDEVVHTTTSAAFKCSRRSSHATALDWVRFVTLRRVAPALLRHFAVPSPMCPAPNRSTSRPDRSPSTPIANSTQRTEMSMSNRPTRFPCAPGRIPLVPVARRHPGIVRSRRQCAPAATLRAIGRKLPVLPAR
jgi:hypothetical protein